MQNKITMKYYTPIRMVKLKKHPSMPHTNENTQELEFSYLADGNVKYRISTL